MIARHTAAEWLRGAGLRLRLSLAQRLREPTGGGRFQAATVSPVQQGAATAGRTKRRCRLLSLGTKLDNSAVPDLLATDCARDRSAHVQDGERNSWVRRGVAPGPIRNERRSFRGALAAELRIHTRARR